MLKRILSLILAVSLCLTAFCVVAEETAEANNGNAVELLEWLEIVFPKNAEQYSSEITRADFAVYMARILGIDDTTDPGDARYYVDMAMYDYAAYSVNCLVEKGILSVSDNKMFRPADPITYHEALKMTVCALGYKPVAETKGGYPAGYVTTAVRLGLTDGVSSGAVQKFTLNDAISVLYEALLAPLYVVDSVRVEADGSITGYRVSEDNTLIYESFGYKHNDGIMTGFDGMNIAFDVIAGEERVVVDGKLYKVSEEMELAEFLGVNTCILSDKEEYIVYAYAKPKNEEVTVIDVKDFAGYDGSRITYDYEDKATRFIDVSTAVVLYNGAIPATGTRQLLNNLESGFVKIIDMDGNGTNDAVIVNDYKAYVFKSANLTKNIIYSKISGQNAIELNSYQKAEIVDTAGSPIELAAIEKDSVLNVMAATDNSRIKIVVTDSVVSGSVEQTWDNAVFRFKVDGGIYHVNKAHQSIKSEIKAGRSATFLLNLFGEAVMVIDGIRENYQVGFLTGMKLDGTFSQDLQFRMFTKNDGIKVFDTIDRLRVDGIRTTNAAAAVKAIPDADCDSNGITAFKSQMVLFKTNADGVISDIDTYNPSYAEDPELTLSRVRDGETALEKLEGRVDKDLPVNGETDFYCVPLEEALASDTQNYKVVKQTMFNRTVKFKFECYKIKGKNEFVDLVLYHMNPNDNAENAWLNSNVFLVGEMVEAVDKDMTAFSTVSGLMQGNKHSIDVYESELLSTSALLSDIEEGDLIRYRTGQTGKVIEIQKLYDADTNTRISWKGDTSDLSLFDPGYGSNFQLSYGYVNKRGESTVSWGYKSGSVVDEALDLSSVKCMYYDSSLRDGAKLYTDGIDGIVDNETAPGEGDIIIVQFVQTMIRSVVVYKR